MTTITINLQDIIGRALAAPVYFQPTSTTYLVDGVYLKTGTPEFVYTNIAGTATVDLSAGNYTFTVEGVTKNIVVTGTGSANLVDLIDLPPTTDPSRALPVGGTTGQVLTKSSNDNYDVEWADSAGGGGSSTTETYNEVPSGTINGVNLVFTTAGAYTSGTLRVYLNGIKQRITNDYTETSSTSFTLTSAPIVGDILEVDYATSSTTNVYNEIPGGTINGVTTVFTTSSAYTSATLRVFLNGLKLRLTTHYTETSSTTFTLDEPPLVGDILQVDYNTA